MQRTMNFLTGALCGAVVGSVVALLLAPTSGQELQSQARSQFDNVLDEARRAAQERQTMLKARLDELRSGDRIKLESDT